MEGQGGGKTQGVKDKINYLKAALNFRTAVGKLHAGLGTSN
jgi:hypothetical protein